MCQVQREMGQKMLISPRCNWFCLDLPVLTCPTSRTKVISAPADRVKAVTTPKFARRLAHGVRLRTVLATLLPLIGVVVGIAAQSDALTTEKCGGSVFARTDTGRGGSRQSQADCTVSQFIQNATSTWKTHPLTERRCSERSRKKGYFE